MWNIGGPVRLVLAAVLAVVATDEALVFSVFLNEAMDLTMVKLVQEMEQPPVARCARQETLVAV